MTGSILPPYLAWNLLFHHFSYFLFMYFHQHLAYEEKKQKNKGFDSTRLPRGHQLFIHICSNIEPKNPGKNRLFREPLQISAKNRFLRFLERIYQNDSTQSACVSCGSYNRKIIFLSPKLKKK